MVLATQNPIEYEGTYPLPEAQLDRFMMLLHLGYPELADEAKMLVRAGAGRPARDAGAGRRRRGDPGGHRGRQGAARRGEPEPLRRRAAAPHARRRPRRARRQPAQRHRRDAGREDARALLRPRLRDARRHQGRRRTGALAPRDPVARGALDRHHRRRRDRRRPPSHAGARSDADGARPARVAARRRHVRRRLGPRHARGRTRRPSGSRWPCCPRGALRAARARSVPARPRAAAPASTSRAASCRCGVEVQRERRPAAGRRPPVRHAAAPSARRRCRCSRPATCCAGRYTLRGLPRGRYRLDKARLVIDDPFGLARSELELPAQGAIVVYPRIFELDRLFPEGGGPNGMSGRYLLARGAGLRPALRARPPERRVAAARPLAVHRAPPEADGEGARGRAARRGRGRARRARRRWSSARRPTPRSR